MAVRESVLVSEPNATAVMTEIVDAVATFGTVSLDQLDQAQLHDRVERKVLLRVAEVPAVLEQLRADYFVMQHLGDYLQGYTTCYLDDDDLHDYRDHHNRKRNRKKIRYRTYDNSSMTFFEVKRKFGGRTVKERQATEPIERTMRDDDAEFLEERTDVAAEELQPVMTVHYERLLLVKKDYTERVTIDVDLRFESPDRTMVAPALAVCEIKQPRVDRTSPAVRLLGRRTQQFSKYCVGMAACEPTLKQNRFKKVFRMLDKLDARPIRLEPAQ